MNLKFRTKCEDINGFALKSMAILYIYIMIVLSKTCGLLLAKAIKPRHLVEIAS